MIAKSIVGDVINYRGMVYGPVNEMGVVALFALACEDLGFVIEEIKAGFPDCHARKQVDRGWERVAIEFEYVSSNFLRHGHDPSHCNLIVCWIHDWDEARVPVLELKSFISERHAKVSAPLERVRIADPVESRIVELSDGGIRNGYINLKPIDEFWPEECLGGNTEPAAKHLIVEFEGIGRVTTDISGRHKSLRTAHATIKEFVSRHRLRAGDKIEILRLAKYEYRVRPNSL